MRVVIVGGTGNISSSIVRLLLEKGHDVTLFNRGLRTAPGNVRVIQGDRRDRETFVKTMRREKFDAAIDMICFTPEEAEASIAAFRGTGHFIHCSTVVTYGAEMNWAPVTEDHPLRPVNEYGRLKAEADRVLLKAYYEENFPVTILKPSTTYGHMRVLRQLGLDTRWLDRIRKNKPIAVCGDGKALHHFLHVDDAAKAFVGALGKARCFGQVYNLVNPTVTTWETYHRTAMKVLGREVEMVGIPLRSLLAFDASRFTMCADYFVHSIVYSAAKILRDIPEFEATVSLEDGLRRTIARLDELGWIENSDDQIWEDRLIEAQKMVGAF